MKKICTLFILSILYGCQSQPAVDTGVIATASPTPQADDDAGNNDNNSNNSNDIVEIENEKDPNVASILKDLEKEINVDPETVASFEEESKGRYLETEKKFEQCKAFPLSFMWKEFSPFFDYNWDKNFESFASLFLAIWERETAFAMPSKGVVVGAHCRSKKKKRRSVIVTSLGGKSIKRDLSKAIKHEKWLKRMYPSCNFKSADYGPMQWNNKYRLTQTVYRKQMEKALLLSSGYKPRDVRKLSKTTLARLIKFNSKALFILGGISLKDGSKQPKTTIWGYNTDSKYRTAVNTRRVNILKLFKDDGSCSPDQILGANFSKHNPG